MADTHGSPSTAPSPVGAGRVTALRHGLRTMATIRWAAVVFAVVQVSTYYIPYPPGVLPWAVGVVVVLAVGAAVLGIAARREHSPRSLRRLGVASLAFDTAVAVAFVAIYTFDPDTAIWAVLYILPLEGALLFQLGGALWTMAAAAALYLVREVYGQVVFDIPFLATSVSFRMGIGAIIAASAGFMARGMLAERDRVEAARAHLERRTEELRESNERLQAARALQDDFLAMTNHELRTPLTAIIGYAAILERRWESLEDAKRARALHSIGQQSKRLLDLVDDVLTATAAQVGQLHVTPRPTALRPVLEGAVQAAGVGAAVECDADLWVRADSQRMGQVVENLLTNARKYGRPPITVTADARTDDVLVVVEDAGDGVPEAFVPRLFQRFTRARGADDDATSGSGLGLAIVKGLAEAQGGSAWYEPVRPHGSRFCISVPTAAPPRGAGAGAVGGAAEAGGSSGTPPGEGAGRAEDPAVG